MQLHDNALDHTEAILIVQKLQYKLTDGAYLAIRMLQTVLEHLLHLVEGILRSWTTSSHVIYSLVDYRVEIECGPMDQAKPEQDLLG